MSQSYGADWLQFFFFYFSFLLLFHYCISFSAASPEQNHRHLLSDLSLALTLDSILRGSCVKNTIGNQMSLRVMDLELMTLNSVNGRTVRSIFSLLIKLDQFWLENPQILGPWSNQSPWSTLKWCYYQNYKFFIILQTFLKVFSNW